MCVKEVATQPYLPPPVVHSRPHPYCTSSGVQGHCGCLQYAMLLLGQMRPEWAPGGAQRSNREVDRLRKLLDMGDQRRGSSDMIAKDVERPFGLSHEAKFAKEPGCPMQGANFAKPGEGCFVADLMDSCSTAVHPNCVWGNFSEPATFVLCACPASQHMAAALALPGEGMPATAAC